MKVKHSDQLTIEDVLPTHEALYAFLKSLYKHERFEGRNDRDYPDYSHSVAQGRMQALIKYRYSGISIHDNTRGEYIWYNTALEIITWQDVERIMYGDVSP